VPDLADELDVEPILMSACLSSRNDANRVVPLRVRDYDQMIAQPSEGDESLLGVFARVFDRDCTLAIEHDMTVREIYAVLARIARSLRFIPFVSHDITYNCNYIFSTKTSPMYGLR
jgi:hypothetical protein